MWRRRGDGAQAGERRRGDSDGDGGGRGERRRRGADAGAMVEAGDGRRGAAGARAVAGEERRAAGARAVAEEERRWPEPQQGRRRQSFRRSSVAGGRSRSRGSPAEESGSGRVRAVV